MYPLIFGSCMQAAVGDDEGQHGGGRTASVVTSRRRDTLTVARVPATTHTQPNTARAFKNSRGAFHVSSTMSFAVSALESLASHLSQDPGDMQALAGTKKDPSRCSLLVGAVFDHLAT